MKIFPKYEIRKFADVERGSVCATFRSGELAMGLVVSDWQVPSAKCWIRFMEGKQDKRWTVSPQIDPATAEPVLVFEDARFVVSFEPGTIGAGPCADFNLAGSAFLMEGKIAISGLVHPKQAVAFYVENGSPERSTNPSLPYFSSWSIQVPDDGAMWRTIFARSVERQRLIEKPRPPAAKGDGPRRSIWQRGARDGEPDGSTSGQGVARRPGRNVRRRPRASLAVTSGQGRRRPPCGSTCRARRFLPGLLRHDERDAPPVCGRPAGVGCPVGQDHVTLALASLAIGLGPVVADQGLGVGLRQPSSVLATPEPSEHRPPGRPETARAKVAQ